MGQAGVRGIRLSVATAGVSDPSIQSPLGTAKLNGSDRAAWLRDPLAKLPLWPDNRIDELLPLHRSTTVSAREARVAE